MWTRRANWLTLASVLAFLVVPNSPAFAVTLPSLAISDCNGITEQSKFVDDWNGSPGSIAAEGNMSRYYAYARTWGQYGCLVVNTVYLSINYDSQDWVEAGYIEFASQGGSYAGYFYPFCEYGDYPSGITVVVYESPNVWSTNRYMWFNVTPVSGVTDTHFKCQLSSDGSSWSTYYTTLALDNNVGLPKGELSKRGSDADSRSYGDGAQFMGSDGWWRSWTGIHCSGSSPGFGDYDVQALSSTSWQIVHTPMVGSC